MAPETPSQPLVALCDDEETEDPQDMSLNVPSPFDTSKSEKIREYLFVLCVTPQTYIGGLEMFVLNLDGSFTSDEGNNDYFDLLSFCSKCSVTQSV